VHDRFDRSLSHLYERRNDKHLRERKRFKKNIPKTNSVYFLLLLEVVFMSGIYVERRTE